MKGAQELDHYNGWHDAAIWTAAGFGGVAGRAAHMFTQFQRGKADCEWWTILFTFPVGFVMGLMGYSFALWLGMKPEHSIFVVIGFGQLGPWGIEQLLKQIVRSRFPAEKDDRAEP